MRTKHIFLTIILPNNYLRIVPEYDDYIVDINGNIYSNKLNRYIKQFNSNGYKQVTMRNCDGKVVKGVHQVVAMSFLDDYFDGCVVHHIDENKQNNTVFNLECLTLSEHSRQHANVHNLLNYIIEHGPVNKGKKMSDEFCQKCKESALKRWNTEKKV